MVQTIQTNKISQLFTDWKQFFHKQKARIFSRCGLWNSPSVAPTTHLIFVTPELPMQTYTQEYNPLLHKPSTQIFLTKTETDFSLT